jgi:hypothetical protein
MNKTTKSEDRNTAAPDSTTQPYSVNVSIMAKVDCLITLLGFDEAEAAEKALDIWCWVDWQPRFTTLLAETVALGPVPDNVDPNTVIFVPPNTRCHQHSSEDSPEALPGDQTYRVKVFVMAKHFMRVTVGATSQEEASEVALDMNEWLAQEDLGSLYFCGTVALEDVPNHVMRL